MAELPSAGALVVDIRSARDVSTGTLPGAILMPLSRSFTTWAGSVLPFGEPLYLVAAGEADAHAAVRQLALIGYDAVPGWMGPEALRAFAGTGRALETARQIGPRETVSRLDRDEVTVIDVRGQREWDGGHIPGARHVPLGLLSATLTDLPQGTIVVHCAAGARAAIAASLLRRLGRDDVLDMQGGFDACVGAGLPVAIGATPETTPA